MSPLKQRSNCVALELYFALQGLSEYQRNFLWKKSYLSESCNPSVGRRYPWAGLRSDQLGKLNKVSHYNWNKPWGKFAEPFTEIS